jgi:hypothetical protein
MGLLTPRYSRRRRSAREKPELQCPNAINRLISLRSDWYGPANLSTLRSHLYSYSTSMQILSALDDFQKRGAGGQNKADASGCLPRVPSPLVLLPMVRCGLLQHVGLTYDCMRAVFVPAWLSTVHHIHKYYLTRMTCHGATAGAPYHCP